MLHALVRFPSTDYAICNALAFSEAVQWNPTPQREGWMRGSQSVELLEGVGGIGVLNSHPDPLVTPKFHQCRQFQVKQSNHPHLQPKLTFSHRWGNTAHVLWCRFVSSLTDIWVCAIRSFWTQHPRNCLDFQKKIFPMSWELICNTTHFCIIRAR